MSGMKRATAKAPPATAPPQQATAPPSCDYEVQQGDTLSSVAESTSGSASRWPGLYSDNRTTVGNDPNLIQPGQHLNVCGDASAYGTDLGSMTAAEADAARADRAAAAVELQDRFQIIDDSFVGPRKPNQLTQAEFDNVATLYSDIRTDHSNVQFDATGSGQNNGEFRSGVMGDLATIMTTRQGRELLSSVAYDQVDGHDNTTTISWAPQPAQASARIGPGGNISDGVNGHGTNAGVQYQPGVDFSAGDFASRFEPDAWANFTSDTALYHELIHANNLRQGLLDGRVDPHTGAFTRDTILDSEAASPNDIGTATEEYDTVGIGDYGGVFTENAYRRERELVTGRDVPVRDNYNGSGT